jgi:hypothetical protein
VPQTPADALDAVRVNNGAGLDVRTLRAPWNGERFDVVYAIDVMHPLANGEQRRDHT